MIMNGNTTKASIVKPVTKVSASEGENLQPPGQETFDPADIDALLQDWGAYLRLRAKIRQLFLQKTD
jgi:hypothetical protein